MNNVPARWGPRVRSWVRGGFVDSAASGARALPLVHAATGSSECDWQPAEAAQVDAAVSAAAAAQTAWAARSPTERGRVLRRAADLLTARNDDIARLEAYDTSRPLQETLEVDVVSARDCFEYYGGIAPTIGGEFIHQPGQSFAYAVKEPLGVTAGIGAWNYPLQGAAWKAAPALACGNAILFKPSEETPLSALALAEVLQEAGLPDGLFQVLLGEGDVGRMLSRHEGISKVSFTGSKPTGIAICKDAADSLKKVQMELGGKSPLIIFEDADLEDAVSAAMMANWYSNGEVCSNGTRVFVQASIKDAFMRRFAERTGKLTIGDPMDTSVQMGALINKAHLEKVLAYVRLGQEEGARLVMGGQPLELPGALAGGAFMTPAIFDACTDDMRIVQEEIFGPVAAVLSFDTEAEVVARANDTQFGLSAGVFTNDIRRAHRVVRDIKAGTTWINNYNLAPAELPWSGQKASGIGASNGSFGVDDWTQVKSVYVEMNAIDCPYE